MIPFQRKDYSNGLVALVHKDSNTPLVTVNILYKVGSKDEQDGKTGLAHFLEHLMFTGSQDYPDFDGILQQFGGQNNAFTNTDITNYYMTIPLQCLELGLKIEADRMTRLMFDPHAFDVQQNVVVEEFNQRYVNPPFGMAWHELRSMVYESHPYQWPTIGRTTDEIRAFKIEDPQGFYQNFYQPGNAIISVAGPVEEAAVFDLIDEIFGGIAGHSVKRNSQEESMQQSARFKTITKAVPHNAMYMAFKIPGRANQTHYTGELLGDVLTSGYGSRLFQRLVTGTPIFERIESFVLAQNAGSLFTIYGVPTDPTATAEELTKFVMDALGEIRQEGISDTELIKVKRKAKSALAFGELEAPTKAMNLCVMEGLGDADMINQEQNKFDLVSQADILAFMDDYIMQDRLNCLYFKNSGN